MPMIHPTDSDFRVCRIDFAALLEIQAEAEERGWATRWSSASALRSQVKNDVVLLRSFMREERNGVVRSYRCLILFATTDGDASGGVATIDLGPARFEALERIDHKPDVSLAFAQVFALATAGIRMITKT